MKLKKFLPTINSPTYFLALMNVMVVWCGVVHYSEVQYGGYSAVQHCMVGHGVVY